MQDMEISNVKKEKTLVRQRQKKKNARVESRHMSAVDRMAAPTSKTLRLSFPKRKT